MSDIVLEARALHRRYSVSRGLVGRRATLSAVSDVSLRIARGTVLGLVGESGCGKSTLARLLLGLEAPSAGGVNIGGQAVAAMDRLQRARKMQVIFQDPNSSLNPRKTVLSIVTLPLRVHGLGDRRARERRAAEMLDLVGLPRRVHGSLPGALSGGQRQRVAIARALATRPDIVICDEPTSALDVSVQAQILNLLQDLRAELGLTYIMISHDLAVVRHLATRVAVMYLGRIVEEADVATLFASPQHPYTRILLNSVLTPDPDQGLPETALGVSFPNPLDLPGGCRFHPRCPDAMAICSREEPATVSNRPGSGVACHLYDAGVEGRAPPPLQTP